MQPDTVLDIRYSSVERAFWIEFGDGFRATLSWSSLHLEDHTPHLLPETVTFDRDDPQTVQLLDAQGDTFDIDAASLRGLVDEAFAHGLSKLYDKYKDRRRDENPTQRRKNS